jgi:hypothetical protein
MVHLEQNGLPLYMEPLKRLYHKQITPVMIHIPFDSVNKIYRTHSIMMVKGKVVPVLNLMKHYAMKAYGGVDV